MIGALVLGVLAGHLGRLLAPGSGVRGCLRTTAVGIVGAFAAVVLGLIRAVARR